MLIRLISIHNRLINNFSITFAPKIEREQVQSLFSYCDVLYDIVKEISLYRFGLSRNKWIDYIYAEKPMLVSYNGYKTMLNEAINGFFIDPENTYALKDKILKVFEMPEEERLRMVIRGKEWVIKHQTLEILQKSI